MRDPRPWTHAALFGSLWGVLELTVGTTLKLAQVPLYGAIMAAIGVVCLVTVRRLQPVVGVCLITGCTAAFVKLFSMGALSVHSLAGILLEAALLELAMSLTGSRRIGAAVGGALAVAITPVQMVIVTAIVAGPEALRALARAISAIVELTGVDPVHGWQALAIVVITCAAAGAATGELAWRISGRVRQRVGGQR